MPATRRSPGRDVEGCGQSECEKRLWQQLWSGKQLLPYGNSEGTHNLIYSNTQETNPLSPKMSSIRRPSENIFMAPL